MTPNKALRRTAKRRSYSPLAFAAGLSRVLAVVQDVHFGHRAGNQNRKKKKGEAVRPERRPDPAGWLLVPPWAIARKRRCARGSPAGSRSHPPCRRRRGGTSGPSRALSPRGEA